MEPYPVDRAYPLEVRALRAQRGVRAPVEVRVMNRERFDWLSEASVWLPVTVEREGRVLYAA